MPKYRLTKEAAQQSIDKYTHYIHFDKENKGLDDKDVVYAKYSSIVENMQTNSEFLLNMYVFDRNKAIKEGLKNSNPDEIKEADNKFHKDYDLLFAEYSSDLLAMLDSINNLRIKDVDISTYEEYFRQAKKQLIDFFNIDGKVYNDFLNNYIEVINGSIEMNKMDNFLNDLDTAEIDDISDIKEELGITSNINNEEKQEEINTSNQKEEIVKEEKYEEINTSSHNDQVVIEEKQEDTNKAYQDEVEKWLKGNQLDDDSFAYFRFENKDIDINYFKESEKFLKDNIKNDNSKSYVTNILDKIQEHMELDGENNSRAATDSKTRNDADLQTRTVQNKIDLKKAYIGGYLKIKEHFDSKNLIQKLFTLGESIQEYKALKKIKNEVFDRYEIKPEKLDEMQNEYFRNKKENPEPLENNEVAEEKQQVTRTQSKEFQNSLIDSLSENKNLDTQKSHDKTTQVNKTMNKG